MGIAWFTSSVIDTDIHNYNGFGFADWNMFKISQEINH